MPGAEIPDEQGLYNLFAIFSTEKLSFNFSEIKNTRLLIVGYLFKQNDILSRKLINNENVMSFTCYEEDEYKLKNNL